MQTRGSGIKKIDGFIFVRLDKGLHVNVRVERTYVRSTHSVHKMHKLQRGKEMLILVHDHCQATQSDWVFSTLFIQYLRNLPSVSRHSWRACLRVMCTTVVFPSIWLPENYSLLLISYALFSPRRCTAVCLCMYLCNIAWVECLTRRQKKSTPSHRVAGMGGLRAWYLSSQIR